MKHKFYWSNFRDLVSVEFESLLFHHVHALFSEKLAKKIETVYFIKNLYSQKCSEPITGLPHQRFDGVENTFKNKIH